MCSFLWLSNSPLRICTTTSLSIHLSVHGHLGGFHVLAVINNTAMTNGIHIVSFNFCFFKVYAQEWDCWVMWWFYSQVFKKSPYCLSQWLNQFAFPPTVQERSLFSPLFPAFIVCRLSDAHHFDRCEVITHCSFDLHFSNNEQC